MRLIRGIEMISTNDLQYDNPRYVYQGRMYILKPNGLSCLMKNKSRVAYLVKQPRLYKPVTS